MSEKTSIHYTSTGHPLPTKVTDFADSVGVDVNQIGAPVGAGYQCFVHEYGAENVVKIPHIQRDRVLRPLRQLITPTPDERERDLDIAREYFGRMVLETTLYRNGSNKLGEFVETQPRIAFDAITPADIAANESLGNDMQTMFAAHRQLVDDHRLWLDAMGVDPASLLTNRPYLHNVVKLMDDTRGQLAVSLPDVSLYRARGYHSERGGMVSALTQQWHQHLQWWQARNAQRLGYKFENGRSDVSIRGKMMQLLS